MSAKADQSAASRAKLVASAAELFSRQGFQRTSVAQIGEAAGISRGSIFWHFGSKDGLLEAVVERAFGDWQEGGLPRDVGDARGLEAVRRAIASHRAFLEAETERLRLFFVLLFESLGPRPQLREHFVALHERLRAETVGWLDAPDVRDDLDPTAVVTVLLGALGGLAYQRLLDPALELEGPYGALTAMAVGGLSRPAAR